MSGMGSGVGFKCSQRGYRQAPQTEERSPWPSTMDQREYEIEVLIAACVDIDGKSLFRVRWNGYGPKDGTREPESNLPRKIVRAARRRHSIVHEIKV